MPLVSGALQSISSFPFFLETLFFSQISDLAPLSLYLLITNLASSHTFLKCYPNIPQACFYLLSCLLDPYCILPLVLLVAFFLYLSRPSVLLFQIKVYQTISPSTVLSLVLLVVQHLLIFLLFSSNMPFSIDVTLFFCFFQSLQLQDFYYHVP